MSAATATLPPIRKWLPYLALAAAVFAAYGNIYSNAFLFDDPLLISANDYLKQDWGMFRQHLAEPTNAGAHVEGGFFRPIQMLVYFLIYHIDGADTFYFHLLNVALHAANACLILLLGRRLRFNAWGTFAAAIIWAVHPLNTEAITYMSGTADPLCTFFCLAALACLAPDFTPRGILAVIPLFALALLSKEGAVVFPALVMTCIVLTNEKRLHPLTYLRTAPLWVLAVGYSIWRAREPGFDGPQSYDKFYAAHNFDNLQLYNGHFTYRFYTFLATLPAYLRLLVWPTGLHMERSFMLYDDPMCLPVWEGLAIVIAASAQIVSSLLKRAQKIKGMMALSWGLLWFAVAYFPETGLIFPMNSQFLEHWMYLPTIGLFLGLAEMAVAPLKNVAWPQAKTAAFGAVLLAATALGVATFNQNNVWHDAFSFYGNIFKYGEKSPRAHNNLALAYMDKDDYPAAIAEFKKTIAMDDAYAETRYNMALAVLRMGHNPDQVREAIADLNRAIEINPDFYRSWEMLGNIYDALGDKEKAATYRQRAETLYKSKAP